MKTGVVAALAMAGALSLAGGARADECPKDKILAKPQKVEDRESVGMTRARITFVDLKGWRGIVNLFLRARRLTVAPGGIVPTHEHDDRPALVYFVKGELTEYSSYCAVPVVYHAGQISAEFGPGYKHWWKNNGTEEVVMISDDIVDTDSIEDDKPMP